MGAKLLTLVEEALPLDVPMVESNPKWLGEHIKSVDQKHDEAHVRLREDLDTLEKYFNEAVRRIGELERAADNIKNSVDNLKTARVDVTSLILSPGTVIAIVMGALAIVGWAYNMQSTMNEKFERAFKGQEMQRVQTESLIKLMIEKGIKPQENANGR